MGTDKKILVVVAHPDDEVLGCGGTIASLTAKGHRVFVLILGEGVTSRDDRRDRRAREMEIQALREASRKAGEILGVEEIFFYDFPDNRFDTVPFLDIVKTVEKVKDKIKPEIIFTHFDSDLNLDHQITYRAVITATRPFPGEQVHRVYAFEIPSSTEWNFGKIFTPNVYFDISHTLNKKLEALACYESELREFPHPRSLEGVKARAKLRGSEIGVPAAEAFELVRCLECPYITT